MFIEFSCDCGHGFRTKRDNAGARVVCPNCLKEMQVPAAAEPKPPTPDVRTSAPPPVPVPPVKQASVKPAASAKGAASQASPAAKAASAKSVAKPEKPRPPMIDEASLSDDLGPMEAPEDSLENLPEFQPIRRKKKKSAERQDDHGKPSKKKSRGKGGGKTGVIVGSIVAGVTLLCVVGFFAVPPLITAMKEAGKITAPTEFEQFRDTDLNFSCLHPKGWTPITRGGTGNVPPSVRLEHGNVKISFRASISGAAIQDTTQAMANQAGELPDELKPVARVHDFQKAKFSDEMTNYQEVGPVEKINTGIGEGRLSTFVASGGFGSKIFGYRATLLTAQFQWNVVCQCSSQREFAAYKPLFRKVIESTGQ